MDKARNFRKIMEQSETDEVLVLTNHYRISGRVYECNDCNKDAFLNLTNVKICTIDEVFSNDMCSCDEYASSYYDWLHINFDNIVAFSFIK